MTEYEKQLRKALKVKFNFEDQTITIREYLHKLLETLWIEGEGFSSKRPFGSSGWDADLITPLVQAGFIEGKFSDVFLDEEPYLESFNQDGYGFITDLIYFSFFNKVA